MRELRGRPLGLHGAGTARCRRHPGRSRGRRRRLRPVAGLLPGGTSLYWTALNKGKRSVAVDLRSSEGRELVVALATAPGPDGGILVDNADVTLVGWSYGGSVVPDVLARIPDRIGSMVYLDAMIPERGRCHASYSTVQSPEVIMELAPQNLDNPPAAGATVRDRRGVACAVHRVAYLASSRAHHAEPVQGSARVAEDSADLHSGGTLSRGLADYQPGLHEVPRTVAGRIPCGRRGSRHDADSPPS
jgi:pimeloyl-ACP methyl ester carboxylesterase